MSSTEIELTVEMKEDGRVRIELITTPDKLIENDPNLYNGIVRQCTDIIADDLMDKYGELVLEMSKNQLLRNIVQKKIRRAIEENYFGSYLTEIIVMPLAEDDDE